MSASKKSQFDEPVSYKAGHVIFVEGEPSSFLYIIISGEIRIFKEDKKRLIPVSKVSSQDFIGELSMFSDEPRSATAIATATSEVILIKKTEIRKIIKTCPDWVSNIMITISDRLRGSIDMLREHNITDDLDEEPIPQKVLNGYIESIKEYRGRRGL